MTSGANGKPSLPALLVVTVGLLYAQLACSLRSLDYLKNGAQRDAEPAEAAPPIDSPLTGGTPDGANPTPGEAGVDAGNAVDTGTATGGGGAIDSGAGGVDGSADAASVDAAGGVSTGGRTGSGGAMDSGLSGTGGSANGGTSGTTAPDHTALLVVASLSLNSGDTAIRSRLLERGFAVTLVTDVDVASSPTVTQDVVVISRTVLSTNMGPALRTTPKPILVSEPYLLGDMGMVEATSGSYGVSNGSSIVVNSAAGALAAGLSGTVVILSSTQELNYGVPNDQAITVASIPNHSTQWAEFAYDTGAQMPGLAAPGRRLGFFFSDSSAAYANSDGWRLFDAALAWLTR